MSFAEDDYEFRYLEDVIAENETADVRNVATTFETKPDWCDPEQIDRMLDLGATNVEVGVQTTFERINREMHRGHGVQASIDANRRLRDSAFKVGFHMMPGQPGMTKEMCVEDFRQLFENSDWRPDYLKIYPTLVVRDTITYDMWRRDEYEPLDNEEAADVVAEVMDMIPRTPDFSASNATSRRTSSTPGVWKSNLRQLAGTRMEERDWTCDVSAAGGRTQRRRRREHRTRRRDLRGRGGTEHFISFEDFENESSSASVGFGSPRPGAPGVTGRRNRPRTPRLRQRRRRRQEGDDEDPSTRATVVTARESGGTRPRRRLPKLAVISGIGVRSTYREKLGYKRTERT